MNRFLFAAAFALFAALSQVPCRAQNLEDVIYFKNGAVVHGLIMEEDPALWLKVKTADGSIHTYSMDNVTKVQKTAALVTDASPEGALGSQPSVGQSPGTAFLLSFLVPGLGCYVNGGDDTKVGLLCDGLYVGGLVTAVAAGYSTTYVNTGLGYTVPTVTTTPFLWVGVGVAFGGWILGMIDAPTYAGNHQPRHNSYGDLFELDGKGYQLGLNLAPGGSPETSAFAALPSPSLALRF